MVPAPSITPDPPSPLTARRRPMSPWLSRGRLAQVTDCSVADRTGPTPSRTSRNSRRARPAGRQPARLMPRSARPPAGSLSPGLAGPAAGVRGAPIPTSTRLRRTSARTRAGTSVPLLTRGAPARPQRTAPGGQLRGCPTRPNRTSREESRPGLLCPPMPIPDVAPAGGRRATPARVPGGGAAAAEAKMPHRRSRRSDPGRQQMTLAPEPTAAARAPTSRTPGRRPRSGRCVALAHPSASPPRRGRTTPARTSGGSRVRRGRATAAAEQGGEPPRRPPTSAPAGIGALRRRGHRIRTDGATTARVIGGRRPELDRPTHRPAMARRGLVRPGDWDLRPVTAARRRRLGRHPRGRRRPSPDRRSGPARASRGSTARASRPR
jgi:hypothetical protein